MSEAFLLVTSNFSVSLVVYFSLKMTKQVDVISL